MSTTRQSVWILPEVLPALAQVVLLETASKLKITERAASTLMNVLLAILMKLLVHAVKTQSAIILLEHILVPVLPDSLVTVKLALISMNVKQTMAAAML